MKMPPGRSPEGLSEPCGPPEVDLWGHSRHLRLPLQAQMWAFRLAESRGFGQRKGPVHLAKLLYLAPAFRPFGLNPAPKLPSGCRTFVCCNDRSKAGH
jgi:hypothetical protein